MKQHGSGWGQSRRALLAGLGGGARAGGGRVWRASFPGAADRPPAASKGPVALVLNGTDAEFGEMSRAPALFEQKYPNVKVQYDNPPDYGTKLFVLAARGQPGGRGHVLHQPGAVPLPGPERRFAPHDPLIARDKYDLKQFYDLAVQALRIDGKLYVLPFKGQIARLFAFYNVDIFEKGGAGAHLLLDVQRPDGRATRLHRGSPDNVETWGYAGAWKEVTTMIGSVRPWGGGDHLRGRQEGPHQHQRGQGDPSTTTTTWPRSAAWRG